MISPKSLAAITLLRHTADRLEKGEVAVYSITQHLVMDEDQDRNTYLPVRTRLEVLVFPVTPKNSKSDD